MSGKQRGHRGTKRSMKPAMAAMQQRQQHAYNKRRQEFEMSRQRDLGLLNQQLQGLVQERANVVQGYEDIRKECEAEINQILEAAGLKEKLDALNAGLEVHRKSCQVAVDTISAKIQEVQKIGQFLLSRDKVDPDTPHIVEGLDINALTFETRAKVLGGDREAIDALKAAKAAREAEAAKAAPAPALAPVTDLAAEAVVISAEKSAKKAAALKKAAPAKK